MRARLLANKRKARKIDQYCLHVAEDGREIRFPGPPTLSYGINYVRKDECPYSESCVLVHPVHLFEAEDGFLFEELEVRSIKVNCAARRSHAAFGT